MKLIAFTLLDTKTGSFGVPFFMSHVGQAIRACIDLGSDMTTTVARHPADFALCRVGFFDDQTGTLEASTPENLGVVVNFLPRTTAEIFPDLQHAPELAAREVARHGNGKAE